MEMTINLWQLLNHYTYVSMFLLIYWTTFYL